MGNQGFTEIKEKEAITSNKQPRQPHFFSDYGTTSEPSYQTPQAPAPDSHQQPKQIIQLPEPPPPHAHKHSHR